jgi:hypothetical protein
MIDDAACLGGARTRAAAAAPVVGPRVAPRCCGPQDGCRASRLAAATGQASPVPQSVCDGSGSSACRRPCGRGARGEERARRAVRLAAVGAADPRPRWCFRHQLLSRSGCRRCRSWGARNSQDRRARRAWRRATAGATWPATPAELVAVALSPLSCSRESRTLPVAFLVFRHYCPHALVAYGSVEQALSNERSPCARLPAPHSPHPHLNSKVLETHLSTPTRHPPACSSQTFALIAGDCMQYYSTRGFRIGGGGAARPRRAGGIRARAAPPACLPQ